MLLRKDFPVLDGLNGSMIVVLVDFTFDCSLDILLLWSENSLMFDSWVHSLMDSAFMLSIPGEKVGNCCLRFVHFE
jgi:hypothetical protein